MAKKEIMHFNNFQEVLAYINGNQKAEELKEYKKPAPKKAEEPKSRRRWRRRKGRSECIAN